MALAHLDPVAAFGRKTRGVCGSWRVCVWGCAGFEANGPGVCCVCVVDASKNMQGTGFEAKRIVPALPGTLSVCVYVCLYIYMCTCVRACVCVCVCVCESGLGDRRVRSFTKHCPQTARKQPAISTPFASLLAHLCFVVSTHLPHC